MNAAVRMLDMSMVCGCSEISHCLESCSRAKDKMGSGRYVLKPLYGAANASQVDSICFLKDLYTFLYWSHPFPEISP